MAVHRRRTSGRLSRRIAVSITEFCSSGDSLGLSAFSKSIMPPVQPLWQAVRRVWRLGQTKPVKAVFSVYNDTMEARALALIGAKMKAAQLL